MLEYDLRDIGTDEDTLEANEQKLLLMNLTDEILIESINEQIEEMGSMFFERTNYLEIFDERYKYITQRFRDIPDLLVEVESARREFYAGILVKIRDKYELSIDEDVMDSYQIFQMVEVLYDFLVLNYIENVKTFVTQYIKTNRRMLSKEVSRNGKTIDASTMRKTVKNQDDVLILANIYKAIDFIIALDLPTDDILKLVISEDESSFTNYLMNKYFIEDDCLVSENFNKHFLCVLNRNNQNYMRMINEIQLDYLKYLQIIK